MAASSDVVLTLDDDSYHAVFREMQSAWNSAPWLLWFYGLFRRPVSKRVLREIRHKLHSRNDILSGDGPINAWNARHLEFFDSIRHAIGIDGCLFHPMDQYRVVFLSDSLGDEIEEFGLTKFLDERYVRAQDAILSNPRSLATWVDIGLTL